MDIVIKTRVMFTKTGDIVTKSGDKKSKQKEVGTNLKRGWDKSKKTSFSPRRK
ncbi:hypothetical protein [Ureibacillus thermophilus]|uniref:hypothetical protein n=1 Tax=Ureibacillus thermophilus TaxID=367743 RepID=UPI0036F43B1B